jgi:hypothetical protein
MKQVLVSAFVAAAVCIAGFALEDRIDDDPADSGRVLVEPRELDLSYTVEPTEDSWVNGARSTGADDRMLSNAETSVCFLTKVEISGVQGPEDTSTCRVDIDDFTGFWKVTAEVPEGSRSEIRCNARCLSWE